MIRYDLPFDEYLALERVSNSALSVYLRDPQEYYQRFVSRELVVAPTAAMQVGSATHESLEAELTGRLFGHRQLVRIPAEVLSKNGARSGAAWKAWRADHPDEHYIALKEHEADSVGGILEALKRTPFRGGSLGEYLAGCKPEASILFDYGQHPGKARIDYLDLEGKIAIDVKTTADFHPLPFARSCRRWGYHRQAAWYLEALLAELKANYRFVFVAVCTRPPYTVQAYQLADDDLAAGLHEIDRALAGIRAERWRHEGYGDVLQLHLPSNSFEERYSVA